MPRAGQRRSRQRSRSRMASASTAILRSYDGELVPRKLLPPGARLRRSATASATSVTPRGGSRSWSRATSSAATSRSSRLWESSRRPTNGRDRSRRGLAVSLLESEWFQGDQGLAVRSPAAWSLLISGLNHEHVSRRTTKLTGAT